jgi:DNA-binding transcriptional MerR regulator
VFELADVAAILGIEKSRVKNWTIGRPFSVRASVRASFGKGSRNLFSRNDVYCLGLVKRLSEVGAPAKAIQSMLEKLGAEVATDAFWKEGEWLFLKRTNRDVSYQTDFDPQPFGYINVRIEPGDEIVCSYAVNLKCIVDAISTKIAIFGRKQTTSARPRLVKAGNEKRSNRRKR